MVKFPLSGVWDPLVSESERLDISTTFTGIAVFIRCNEDLCTDYPWVRFEIIPIRAISTVDALNSSRLVHFVEQFPACGEHLSARMSAIDDFDHLLR